MRISYWEKLTVLNAGTLALSFTAAAAFRGHAIGDGGLGYLFAAWKNLIASIALCLVAQWLTWLAATHFQRFMFANLIKRKLDRVRDALGPVERSVSNMEEAYQRIEKAAKGVQGGYDRAAQFIGIVAQIFTIVAYVWLYKFAHLNLQHL